MFTYSNAQMPCLVLVMVPLSCDVLFGVSVLFWGLVHPHLSLGSVTLSQSYPCDLFLWGSTGLCHRKPEDQGDARSHEGLRAGRAWPQLPRARASSSWPGCWQGLQPLLTLQNGQSSLGKKERCLATETSS